MSNLENLSHCTFRINFVFIDIRFFNGGRYALMNIQPLSLSDTNYYSKHSVFKCLKGIFKYQPLSAWLATPKVLLILKQADHLIHLFITSTPPVNIKIRSALSQHYKANKLSPNQVWLLWWKLLAIFLVSMSTPVIHHLSIQSLICEMLFSIIYLVVTLAGNQPLFGD